MNEGRQVRWTGCAGVFTLLFCIGAAVEYGPTRRRGDRQPVEVAKGEHGGIATGISTNARMSHAPRNTTLRRVRFFFILSLLALSRGG